MRSPSSSSRPRARVASLALVVAAAGLLGATCEDQDYTAPDRLELVEAAVFEPRIAEFDQPYRGLNTLDYRIVNTGSASARFGLFAVASYATTEADNSLTTVENATSRITDPLSSTGEASGRIFETELGLGERIHVEFVCYDDDAASAARCSGTLDFTVLLRQVECRIDSDCGVSEECDTARGRCRTSEQSSGACQSGAPAPATWPVLAALAVLLWRATARRRPS